MSTDVDTVIREAHDRHLDSQLLPVADDVFTDVQALTLVNLVYIGQPLDQAAEDAAVAVTADYRAAAAEDFQRDDSTTGDTDALRTLYALMGNTEAIHHLRCYPDGSVRAELVDEDTGESRTITTGEE